MTGTRDISESSLLEESKESISPLKTGGAPGDDSLFNISQSEINKGQEPKAEAIEDSNPLAKLAKRKMLL